MFSLHQLRCFLATYEHGSLTAAAEELGYAQPSISEQIRSLEKSCGAQLFRRVGRGVVPTTVADALRPHVQLLWRELSPADRRRFVRHVRPWWEVHRHRMAPPIAEAVAAARRDGSLQVSGGRLLGMEPGDRGVEVRWRARDGSEQQLLAQAAQLSKSGYGEYLRRVAEEHFEGSFIPET